MKRTLSLLFIFIIMLSLALVANASENTGDGGVYYEATPQTELILENEDDYDNLTSLKAYIEEKILPIMVGVVTSIIALLSTLKGVFSALKSLKETKEQLDTERDKIKVESQAELEKITQKYNEIKEEIKCIVKVSEGLATLKEKTETLSKEIANLSEIAALGFCKDKDLVLEGASREIVILAEKNKELTNREEI